MLYCCTRTVKQLFINLLCRPEIRALLRGEDLFKANKTNAAPNLGMLGIGLPQCISLRWANRANWLCI